MGTPVEVLLPHRNPLLWKYESRKEVQPGDLVLVDFRGTLEPAIVLRKFREETGRGSENLKEIVTPPIPFLPSPLFLWWEWWGKFTALSLEFLLYSHLFFSPKLFSLKIGEEIYPLPRKRKETKEGEWALLYKDIPSPPIPSKEKELPPPLREEQEEVLRKFGNSHPIALLHGVTGSGKTEVYLRLTEETIQKGGRVAILAPEIALAESLKDRFERRFPGKVAIWHSKLSPSLRERTFLQIYYGRYPILVGTKSALFLPSIDFLLWIVDEEHDGGYEVGEKFRIPLRELLAKRVLLSGARLLLGSATPSLESYLRAREKKIAYFTLSYQPSSGKNVKFFIVDRKNPQEKTSYPWLSRTLLESIQETLSRGEQVILFRNRRGYFPFGECRRCGNPILCKNCTTVLAYHKTTSTFLCHTCGFRSKKIPTCPYCGTEEEVEFFGTGTQRIEEDLKTLFPEEEIVRLDRDTITSSTRIQENLKKFSTRKSKILIGTQMVTKGFDFPAVTLVGILDIDGELFSADYRSRERVFQKLVQVSGRTGRGEFGGKVVLQTRHPELPLLLWSLQGRFSSFAETEEKARKNFSYPPFGYLLRIVVWDEKKERGLEILRKISLKMKNFNLKVLGPAPAPLEKAKGKWRYHLLVLGKKRSLFPSLLSEIQPLLPPSSRIEWNPYEIV